MAKYFLTNKAIADLSEIWNYTYNKWSEEQADNYYFQLLQSCQELAENQRNGKSYPEIDNSIYGYKSNLHIIFYSILNSNEIKIIRILHSRMNLKDRIGE